MALFGKSKENTKKTSQMINRQNYDDIFDTKSVTRVPKEVVDGQQGRRVAENIKLDVEIDEEAVNKAAAEFDEKLRREREKRLEIEKQMQERHLAEERRKLAAGDAFDTSSSPPILVDEEEIKRKLVVLEKNYQAIEEKRKLAYENIDGVNPEKLEKAVESFESYCEKRPNEAPDDIISEASFSEYEKRLSELEGMKPFAEGETAFAELEPANVDEYYEKVESELKRNFESEFEEL